MVNSNKKLSWWLPVNTICIVNKSPIKKSCTLPTKLFIFWSWTNQLNYDVIKRLHILKAMKNSIRSVLLVDKPLELETGPD